jgi:Amt family ammonium transporter
MIRSELNMVWVAVACVLVFLMRAGLMFLEIDFSRQKNAATGVAKIFVNFAVSMIALWAIGYGIAEGRRQQGLRRQRLLLPLRSERRR